MLDHFGKGGDRDEGMVGTASTPVVTAPLLQERGGNNSFTHEALTLKYKLDNQFELVFVVSDPPHHQSWGGRRVPPAPMCSQT